MNRNKSIAPASSVTSLNNCLLLSGEEYLLESELPASKVYIKFTGMFYGESVVWNACIQTIDDYSQYNETAKDPMQFIEIDVENGVYFLQVGLNVALIDKPTIERTILMIRNYKRLHQGRHEYGARSKTL
jgi:hypothetical protein